MDLQAMQDRIALLERQVEELTRQRTGRAAWRVAPAGAMLAAAALFGMLVGGTTANADPKPLSGTVRAPFEVVNAKGAPVFQVLSSGGLNVAYLFDSGGDFAAGMEASSTGEDRLFFGPPGGYHGELSAPIGSAAIELFNAGKPVAAMRGSATGGSVNVGNTASTTVGSLGATAQGAGYVQVNYKGGDQAAQLTAHPQGGYLAIVNPGGTARVEAGVLVGDIGVVRSWGPGGFNAIVGRKAGD